MTFTERKEQRTKHYMDNVFKKKLKDCPACSGNGYYDNTGSPPCESCNGTGKERNETYHHI